MESLVENRKNLSIPVNRITCILFYLGVVLNIDMAHLFYLYKKFSSGEVESRDVLYVFFMFSGRKLTVPKPERLTLYIQGADFIYTKITKNPNLELTKVKDIEIYNRLIDTLNDNNMEIEV